MSPKAKAVIAALMLRKEEVNPKHDRNTIVKAVCYNAALEFAIKTIEDVENNKLDDKTLKELQEFYDGQ